jgi:hypothetical protein
VVANPAGRALPRRADGGRAGTHASRLGGRRCRVRTAGRAGGLQLQRLARAGRRHVPGRRALQPCGIRRTRRERGRPARRRGPETLHREPRRDQALRAAHAVLQSGLAADPARLPGLGRGGLWRGRSGAEQQPPGYARGRRPGALPADQRPVCQPRGQQRRDRRALGLPGDPRDPLGSGGVVAGRLLPGRLRGQGSGPPPPAPDRRGVSSSSSERHRGEREIVAALSPAERCGRAGPPGRGAAR